MSGPAYRNGDGPNGSGGGDDGLPRVPQQRDRHDQQDRPEPASVPDPDALTDPVATSDPDPLPDGDGLPDPEAADDEPETEPEPGPDPGLGYDPARDYGPARDADFISAYQRPPYGHQVSASARMPHYDHATLKSLLGAWALTACSRDESLAVEVHLTDCASCAEEALRLREAVGLLHQEESLDLDPLLRARVLEGCLGRRPARIPVPEWAGPYDAEAARLDALLRDLGDGYWRTPVELRWFERETMTREVTVGQVIAHLTAVDSLVGRALGLPGAGAFGGGADGRDGERHAPAHLMRTRFWRARGEAELPLEPQARSAAHWSSHRHLPGATLRSLWREQSHRLVRTVSFAGGGAAGLTVEYGSFELPLQDALVDRAFECWMHAGDIAEAVDYPYEPPSPRVLHRMVDLAARLLPSALADRRRAGLTAWPSRLLPVGAPGRALKLEIEGHGGGMWYLPLDSPRAQPTEDDVIAHVVLDSLEFCQLAAGHVLPEDAAVGRLGDRTAISDVLYAAASLSRM